jgi:hypothetical protein
MSEDPAGNPSRKHNNITGGISEKSRDLTNLSRDLNQGISWRAPAEKWGRRRRRRCSSSSSSSSSNEGWRRKYGGWIRETRVLGRPLPDFYLKGDGLVTGRIFTMGRNGSYCDSPFLFSSPTQTNAAVCWKKKRNKNKCDANDSSRKARHLDEDSRLIGG